MLKELQESIEKSWESQPRAAKSAQQQNQRADVPKAFIPPEKAVRCSSKIPSRTSQSNNRMFTLTICFESFLICFIPNGVNNLSCYKLNQIHPCMRFEQGAPTYFALKADLLLGRTRQWKQEHDWARAKLQNVKSRKRTNKNVLQIQ